MIIYLFEKFIFCLLRSLVGIRINYQQFITNILVQVNQLCLTPLSRSYHPSSKASILALKLSLKYFTIPAIVDALSIKLFYLSNPKPLPTICSNGLVSATIKLDVIFIACVFGFDRRAFIQYSFILSKPNALSVTTSLINFKTSSWFSTCATFL